MSDERENSDQPAPQRPVIKVDPAHVPSELHFLIPYAEKWGITDGDLRHALLKEISVAELEDLSTTVKPYVSTITKALYFPPIEDTPEERIFFALMMASSGASMELREMRWREEAKAKRQAEPPPSAKPVPKDKVWVEAVGWPDNYPDPKLNPAHVPPELHSLIPYAGKWGIPDQDVLRKLLRQVPLAEADELYATMYPLWENINEFTIYNPAPDGPARHEFSIFEAFRSAFGEAGEIVGDANPKRWLEIIGWPEDYPGAKLDPANVPPELHALIPLVEKWVGDDDYVRDVAIRVASTTELKEFVSVANQVGVATISELALQMTVDKMRQSEGYILLTLLELVEQAEFELERRRSRG